MNRKNIQNIIHDHNLKPFMKDGKDNIFSVYYLDNKTNSPKFALLCHASMFTHVFFYKHEYENYMQKLSEAFRVLPVDDANTFKRYIGMDLSANLTTTFDKEKPFGILQPNSDPRDYSFRLLTTIDDKDNINITIDGLYKPMPPITFDKHGNFIPSDSNPCDLPEL